MADEKKHRSPSSESLPETAHQDRAGSPSVKPTVDNELSERQHAAALAENPLAGKSKEELHQMAEEYCAEYGFAAEEDIRVFRLGALIAGNEFQWDDIPGLTEAEVAGLEFERDHKWKSLPKTLVGVVVVCVSGLRSIYYLMTYRPLPPPTIASNNFITRCPQFLPLPYLHMLTQHCIGTVRCSSRNG